MHLLDIADLAKRDIEAILELSQLDSSVIGEPLGGKGVALLFEKPSNRTRHSMEMATFQLGGHPVYTRGEEVGLDSRESVEDVTRILAGYHAIIAARVFAHSTVRRMAESSSVPVVNMLSDHSHPLQAFADALTMVQHVGPIAKMTVAWVGDYNNVARSLGEIVCILGGTVRFACPMGHEPSDDEVRRLASLGGAAEYFVAPEQAVIGSNVVHTDTWISMGQESEAVSRRRIFEKYQVTEPLMRLAEEGARLMHCMPAHRGEEVSAEVFDGPRSLVIQQGHNRMHTARGVLAFLAGKRP